MEVIGSHGGKDCGTVRICSRITKELGRISSLATTHTHTAASTPSGWGRLTGEGFQMVYLVPSRQANVRSRLVSRNSPHVPTHPGAPAHHSRKPGERGMLVSCMVP